MNIEQISKKLEEIRAETYNSVSDSEKDDFKIQIEQQDELELEEDLNEPEVVKPDRPKAETRPEIKTLSRATSMDGGKGADEKIYVTDGTLKGPTMNELQKKLDVLKALKAYEMSVNMNIRKQLDELKKERRIRDINKDRDVNDPLRTRLGYSEKRYRNRIEGYLNDINKAIEKPFSVLKDMDGQTLPDKYNVRQGTVTEEDRERYTVAINKLIKTSYELQNILSELEGWGN